MKWLALPLVGVLAGLPVVTSAADIGRGGDFYGRYCSNCHGHDGRPVLPGAPDLSRPTALLKPDLELLMSIRSGRGAMPAYQGLMRDREILDVVAYLRTLIR